MKSRYWTSKKNDEAVSLIVPARKDRFLNEVFLVAERLMTDNDDMVQKGVGFLLKEASRKHPKEIHDFLLKWKEKAPAPLLRYASKLLPENMRVQKTR
ncbi:MAG: DNA alkylation repair protein [Candidatus Bathyarchaeota archaeon]|nr:DNA alkylation repair protein [Candidatus Bathyarchaeota archaeon]